MAKLDPANWKSAKDVYDERSAEAARKRKREQLDEKETGAAALGLDTEQNLEQQIPSKKQKINDPAPKPVIVGKVGDLDHPDQIVNKNLRKKMKKRANRHEKKQEIQGQKEQRKAERAAQKNAALRADVMQQAAAKQEQPSRDSTSAEGRQRPNRIVQDQRDDGKSPKVKKPTKESTPPTAIQQNKKAEDDMGDDENTWSDVDEEADGNINDSSIDSGEENEDVEDADSTATSSDEAPDILSPTMESAASSVSSIIPPAGLQTSNLVDESKKDTLPGEQVRPARQPTQNEAERTAARQRLQNQISRFRSQRKADARPVRSRAELLEQRRRTEAERKAAKKEQRRKQKEEESRLQDEEMAKRFSPGGSGSLLASPRSPIVDSGTNETFTFGRIAFEDGTYLDPNTLSAVEKKRHKGASDPASALQAAQAKKERIAGLDSDKKREIEEKDMWLNARKRAQGERVKDDTSLLKKALKRQEKQKQRSERDWDQRTEGVRASQEAKQRKRSENLQKRKDEKLSKKKGAKVKRPGFEGSFRSRTGKGKKS